MTAVPEPRAVAAAYFDGHSSARRPVTLEVAAGRAIVTGEGVARSEPLAAVRLSERLGAAPRLVTFSDGAFCEVRDHVRFEQLLAASGYRESPVARMQSSWHWAAAAVVACMVALLWAYYIGVPWLARVMAERTPAPVVAKMSEMTLDFLDHGFLEPSRLAPARRDQLARKFARLVPPEGAAIAHQVVFREGGAVGANAFALPSGTLVVTDELVGLADDDDEILAVLTHELGHVSERHGLRLVLESSIVGLAVTWYLGDFSSLAAGVPAALLRSRYSRGHEREADAYGARMLRANGLSPLLLASMLEKLERSHAGDRTRRRGEPRSQEARRGGPESERSGGDETILDYVASHPATAERVAALRAMASR